MRDEDALQLAARKGADPGLGEAFGPDGRQHLVDDGLALPRREPETEPVAVDAEHHQVAGPQGDIGVEHQLLRDVAGRAAQSPPRGAGHGDPPAARPLQAEDDAQQRGLARTVGPDEPGELTRPYLEGDVVEDRAPPEDDAEVLDRENGPAAAARGTTGRSGRDGRGHRCSVETLLVTAASIAFTSAVIQVW